ncbi:hypothetical protein QUB63_25520 [Microcoleus sp. ARI1-B5]
MALAYWSEISKIGKRDRTFTRSRGAIAPCISQIRAIALPQC